MNAIKYLEITIYLVPFLRGCISNNRLTSFTFCMYKLRMYLCLRLSPDITRSIDVKQVEYIGEVLDDGHLSLPEKVKEELALKPASVVQVVLAVADAAGEDVDKAWELFRSMGNNAAQGNLSNPAKEHDKYLYGRDGR